MKTYRPFLSRRVTIGAALVALVAALCWMLIPKEPSFEGLTLSEWMMSQDDADFEGRSTSKHAIQVMGAEAAAVSLDWLKREDGWLSRKVFDFLGQHFSWEPGFRRAVHWHYAASEVFRILGPEARSAIPELVSLTQSNTPTALRIRAIKVLGALGPMAEEAVPHLLRCLKDADPKLRIGAAWSLGSIGRQPAVVVPKLLACLEDTNRFDVPILLYAFLGFTNESDQVVPALETHLQRATTAPAAAAVLIHFGPAANWPLARALRHPEAKVRTAAAQALMRILEHRPQYSPANGERLRVISNHQTMSMLNAGTYDRSRFTVARALARNLDHPDLELRHYFADLIVEFSDAATLALPEVIQALSSDDIYVAFRAWMVLDLMPLDEVEFASPLPTGRRSQR